MTGKLFEGKTSQSILTGDDERGLLGLTMSRIINGDRDGSETLYAF